MSPEAAEVGPKRGCYEAIAAPNRRPSETTSPRREAARRRERGRTFASFIRLFLLHVLQWDETKFRTSGIGRPYLLSSMAAHVNALAAWGALVGVRQSAQMDRQVYKQI